MLRKVLFIAAMGLSSLAAANANNIDAAKGDFQRQRQAVVAALADGKSYVEIAAVDKREVLESLDRMSELFNSAGSIEAMDDDQRVSLLNQQERINGILSKAYGDSRLVCERSAPVGTRLKTNNCSTVAERRRRREEDQKTMMGRIHSPLERKE